MVIPHCMGKIWVSPTLAELHCSHVFVLVWLLAATCCKLLKLYSNALYPLAFLAMYERLYKVIGWAWARVLGYDTTSAPIWHLRKVCNWYHVFERLGPQTVTDRDSQTGAVQSNNVTWVHSQQSVSKYQHAIKPLKRAGSRFGLWLQLWIRSLCHIVPSLSLLDSISLLPS